MAGSAAMLLDPSGKLLGMDAMLPFFQVLPLAEHLYQDFFFPGIALLVVNGITNLVSAILLFKQKKSGVVTGALWGFTLILWICIQFYIFPMNLMSSIYFVFGLIQLATGFACYVFYCQESFAFNRDDYRNIGKTGDSIVLYFSRLGASEKVAYETADGLGADVEEIKTSELTKGTLGFWWCGRFGMHGWEMETEPLTADLSKYRRVIICGPIWVFSPAAPLKGLCTAISGNVENASYVFTHFNPRLPPSAAESLNKRLGLSHSQVESVQCRWGRIKSRKRVG